MKDPRLIGDIPGNPIRTSWSIPFLLLSNVFHTPILHNFPHFVNVQTSPMVYKMLDLGFLSQALQVKIPPMLDSGVPRPGDRPRELDGRPGVAACPGERSEPVG